VNISEDLQSTQSGIDRGKERIKAFEQQYGMTSAEFLQRYENDELQETLELDEWIGEIRMLQGLQEKAARLASQKPDEASLMQIIQQQPSIDRTRLNELRDRCEYGHLSPEEHRELIEYENELELHNARRIEAILHLAKLKDIDFAIFYQQLTPKRKH
jgi:hypothetical protein